MKLSIVLLNFNKSSLTLKCLSSLYGNYESEFAADNFEIILVDNASEPVDLKNLKEGIKKGKFNNLKIVESDVNGGFSKGCNIGADKARGDVLLFLNNDTEVKDKGISQMLEYITSNTDADILGGELRNPDGSEQSSVGRFYNPINALLFLLGLQRLVLVGKNPDKISQVDWVKGGCMMIKKQVFESLSGFDENIFMYIEDMELCYRARKNGYLVFFYPHVTIEHADQGSSSRSFAIVNIYQSLLYFYKKHRSKGEYMFLKSILRSKALLLYSVGRVVGNKYLISTYEKALKVV
jgi:GT2 family glycosyltransferase